MDIDPLPHPEKIHPSAFIAPGVVLVGDVRVGAEASLWFGVVARGDVQTILIGPRTNVQDGAILHVEAEMPCQLGAGVTVGHGAIIHSAVVEDEVLIGIRATVLHGAHIGRGSVIAAGALIPPDMVVPPGSVVMGVPGKVVRAAGEAEQTLIRTAAVHYCEYARAYQRAYREPRSRPESE